MTAANKAISQLLGRSTLASFKVVPRPQSFADSMAVFSQVQSVVSKQGGRIMHYRQDTCPVTKERLEDLTVLLEDPKPLKERVEAVVASEPVAELSEMEQQLLARFSERLQLRDLTRDPAEITKKINCI